MPPPPCPCGSTRPFAACCEPFHRGDREAPDAESLMRSRYSAFARGDVEYLVRTLHPDHADREAGDDALRRSLRDSVRRHRYAGLHVLDTRAPGADGLAEVLFHATILEGKNDRSFVERSYFAHDGTGWRYLAGDLVPSTRERANDPMTLDAFDRVLKHSRR